MIFIQWLALFSLLSLDLAEAFSVSNYPHARETRVTTFATVTKSDVGSSSDRVHFSRRSLIHTFATTTAAFLTSSSLFTPHLAFAAESGQRVPLDELLYNILRVREATQQETRLISSGKFKDMQRANVKLAIKFMIENYRLADTFVLASNYLEGGYQKRVEAGQVGQSAVQNLYTILEYFDSADVQNIKVGSSMTGKEEIVMKGLDATRKSIDEFLAYFPKAEVDVVRRRVQEENDLNIKEFDSALGTIVNMPQPN